MSMRIIKIILNKKFESWKESIKNDKVRSLVEKNTIITGGCIASLLLKEEIKDFDFYFKDYETCLAVANYYTNEFISTHTHLKIIPSVDTNAKDLEGNPRVRIRIQSAGVVGENTNDKQYQYFEGRMTQSELDSSLMPAGEEYIDEAMPPSMREQVQQTMSDGDEVDAGQIGSLHGASSEKGKFRPVFLTDNAITLSDKIQLIIRFYGQAEDIHKNYDFVHCTNYWDSETKKLVLKPEALESLLLKRLYYIGSKYPLCSFIRTRKFIQRGWYIDAGQMVKICFQISKLNLEDLYVLEDQLTGVDQAYFTQMITYMRAEQVKDSNWVVDLPYLVSIIDKIF